MRSYLVVAGDFVRTGGMDTANRALAAYLARSGRETHLVTHRADAELASLPGVWVHPVPRPLGSHLLGFPLLDRAGRRQAERLATRNPVVVANGGNCAAGEVTWLHYVHAAYDPDGRRRASPPALSGRKALRRWSRRQALADERAAVRRARVVIANSDLTRRHAVELLGADPGRVRTVYYGTDPERFRPPTPEERSRARSSLEIRDDTPVAVFVGALGDRRKGFDTLFRAWAELGGGARSAKGEARIGSAEADAVLLVVGTGSELPAWRARAETAGLGARIRFLGFRDDVRPVLWAGDVLVSPTRYEAYGLAVQEAVCCGLPALVSADAGVAERYPDPMRPLLLADPDDAAELGNRLHEVLSDAGRYRAAALALSDELRAWTWDRMAARIVDIIEGRA